MSGTIKDFRIGRVGKVNATSWYSNGGGNVPKIYVVIVSEPFMLNEFMSSAPEPYVMVHGGNDHGMQGPGTHGPSPVACARLELLPEVTEYV